MRKALLDATRRYAIAFCAVMAALACALSFACALGVGGRVWADDGSLAATSVESSSSETEADDDLDVAAEEEEDALSLLDDSSTTEGSASSDASGSDTSLGTATDDSASDDTATDDAEEDIAPASVSYRLYKQGTGWKAWASDGAKAGSSSWKKKTTALKIKVSSSLEGSVTYRVYSHGSWGEWASDGAKAGYTGKNYMLQAVQVELTGELAEAYDVWYRVWVAGYGWSGWASNGEAAGSAGLSAAAKVVQVRLVEKGGSAPGSTSKAYRTASRVSYRALSKGSSSWQASRSDGATAGTTTSAKRLVSLRVSLPASAEYEGSIRYRVYVRGSGWKSWRSDGAATSKATSSSRYVTAVQIELTGEMAENYDVYYRVYVEGVGWLDWAKNGAKAGTTGLSCEAYGVQVKLVKKGAGISGSTDVPYLNMPTASYSAYVAGTGWKSASATGKTAGSTKLDAAVTALRVSFSSTKVSGTLKCRVSTGDSEWGSYASSGKTAGTASKSAEGVEAVKIKLTGEAAEYYDVWYRVYIEDYGWLGWTKDAKKAGTDTLGLKVEAVQVTFRVKGSDAPGSTTHSYFTEYYYIGWQNPSNYPQVNCVSVTLPSYCTGKFAYVTPSRISYDATYSEVVNAFIARALEYVGTKYVWDYSLAPGKGVDCSGLVLQALYAVGMDVSPMNPWDHYWTAGHDHYANYMWTSGMFKKVSYSKRKRGDIICWPGHVAIYLGNNKIVEAVRSGVRVTTIYNVSSIRGCLRVFVK